MAAIRALESRIIHDENTIGAVNSSVFSLSHRAQVDLVGTMGHQ